MLAVHRQDGHAVLLCQGHDQMPGRHQRLLVGKRDGLSALNGCDGRTDSDHSYHRRHQHFITIHCRQLQQSVHTAQHVGLQIADTGFQLCSSLLTPHDRSIRSKLPDLFFHQGRIASGRKSRHLQIRIFSYDFQCLGSDGSGGTQNCDFLHYSIPSLFKTYQKNGKIVNDGRRKKHTVKPVHHPAVAGNQLPVILDSVIPLNARGRQISDL